MLRKKLAVLVAAALMTLSASSAFAAFSSFSLIRVISDSTAGSTTEVATDLGNINTLIGASNLTVGGGADAFTLYTNPTHNLSINYYAWATSTTTKGTLYIASNNATAPTAAGSALTKTALNSIQTFYAGQTPVAGSSTVVTSNTTVGSFGQKMGMTALGGYANYVAGISANTNLKLDSLATAPLFMTLWKFADVSAITGTSTGVQALTLTTNADGSTTINAGPVANTPIPAAFYLMGSGLLGLVGLRRRNKVA
jgi:hypothetical protein